MKKLTVQEFMDKLSNKDPDDPIFMIDRNEPDRYPLCAIDEKFNIVNEFEDGSVQYDILKDYDFRNEMSSIDNNPLDFFSIVMF